MTTYTVTLTLTSLDSNNTLTQETLGACLSLSQTSDGGKDSCDNPPKTTNSAELAKFCTTARLNDIIKWLGHSDVDGYVLTVTNVEPNNKSAIDCKISSEDSGLVTGTVVNSGHNVTEDYTILFNVTHNGADFGDFHIDPKIVVNPT